MMTSKSDIKDTHAEVHDITAARIVEMDAATDDIHPQRYKTSIKNKNTSWTTLVDRDLPATPLNLEDKPSNNDTRMRRASFGGNDGRGAPFFSSLTKQKRTNTAWSQASFDEQVPAFGFPEKLYRKWVTGRSAPNTHEDIKKGEYTHPVSGYFSPPK